MANLTGKGGFKKGESGNSSGRPKIGNEERDLIEACKVKSVKAIEVIEEIMLKGENERNRITAALSIIERAYGKAAQTTNVNITKNLRELTEEQLLSIASSAGTTSETRSEEEPNSIH